MKLKQITTAAMFASLIAIIVFLDSRFAYLFSQYLGYFLPVPITILTLNMNRKTALLAIIASVMIILMFGNLLSLFFVIPGLIIGYFLGDFILRKLNNRIILYGLSILNIIFVLIQYYFSVYILQIDQNIMLEMQDLLKMLNLSLTNFDMLLIVMVVLYVLAILQTVIVVILTIFIQKRLFKQEIVQLDLSDFHLSKIFGVISILCYSFLMMKNNFHLNELLELCLAILLGLIFVLNIVAGISLCGYYLIKYHKSYLLKFLPLLILIPMVIQVFLVTGIIDSFLDIRRRSLHENN